MQGTDLIECIQTLLHILVRCHSESECTVSNKGVAARATTSLWFTRFDFRPLGDMSQFVIDSNDRKFGTNMSLPVWLPEVTFISY